MSIKRRSDRKILRLSVLPAAVILFITLAPFLLMAGHAEAHINTDIISFDETDADNGDNPNEDADAHILSVDPTTHSDGYSAVLYDNTNGLPTSEANAIVQTSDGFIWIGSYSGLIRYDGNTFERMTSIGIPSVVSLYVDSHDRLWIGSNDSGAAVVEGEQTRIFNKTDGLNSLYVRSIIEDSEGNIYLGTTSGVSIIDSDMNVTNLDDPKIRDHYVMRLFECCDGSICGVTREGAVFTVKNGVLTGFYDSSFTGVNNIHAVLPDPEKPGYFYFGTTGTSIYYGRLDSNGFDCSEITSVTPLSYINAIYSIEDMIWICTDTGMGVLRDGTVDVVDYVPMTSSVDNMMVDYMGNLWFVSSKQGVMKIVPNRFNDLFAKYDIEEELVYSTCLYENMLLIGTKTRGLIAISNGQIVNSIPVTSSVSASGTVYDRDEDLIEMFDGYRIRSIIPDSQGRVWISSFSEQPLVRFGGGEVVKFTSEDGLPSDRVRAVYECDDGSFLVCCTGGLAVIKDDKVIRVYDETDGLTNTEILTAAEAPNGDYIIGTDGGGLYVISDDGITHIGTDEGLSSDVIMRVKTDKKRDLVWLVASNAICYLTEDYEIHVIDQFPYTNNFDLYENSKNEMWILSSNGIYVTDVDSLLNNEDINPLFYGSDNGMSTMPTSNSYSELLSNGDLFIAGSTGVDKVNIEQSAVDVSDFKIAVPYVQADDEFIYPDDAGKFVIPADTERLTIYSYVFNYSLINPTVTYRLVGFESRSTVVNRSELAPITYTNLDGGEYIFKMQVDDPHGSNSQEISVVIVKKKAFWEQVWVRILAFVALIAIICGVIMFLTDRRTKAFLKKEEEQKELIREIVEAFAKVIDMKDKYTNGHSTRVAEFTAMLTRELGYDEDTIEKYYNIALMHDIGKIGIPPEVLNKPGKLDDNEYHVIQSHASLGYDTLKDISIMPELATGAGAHHERPDGKGYPNGLKGDEIPRVAQIIAVADTFDAMYSERPYRKRMNFERVVSIIKDARGTQLTADVVDAFLRLVEKGEFRAPDDVGGGTTEDINNIHKKFNKEK